MTESSKTFPQPNQWSAILPQFDLKKPLRVAMPCCGLDGFGWSLRDMNIKVEGVNVCDIEDRYVKYLKAIFGDSCKVGKSEGDVLQMPAQDLKLPVHMLGAGPPCPGWSIIGTGEGPAFKIGCANSGGDEPGWQHPELDPPIAPYPRDTLLSPLMT